MEKIDCEFIIEVCIEDCHPQREAHARGIIDLVNPRFLQCWFDDEFMAFCAHATKPFTHSDRIQDHIIAAKEWQEANESNLRRLYPDALEDEVYVLVTMVYLYDDCTYQYDVNDYAVDSTLLAENVTCGDYEELPALDLLRAKYQYSLVV